MLLIHILFDKLQTKKPNEKWLPNTCHLRFDFEWILWPFWHQKSIKNALKNVFNFQLIFQGIWGACLGAFCHPGSSKIELSPAWHANFHKIGVVGSGWILIEFRQVFGCVFALKSMRKSIEKIIKIFIDFLMVFWTKMELKWRPGWAQMPPKIDLKNEIKG